MAVEFRILGPLELSADGRVVPLGSPKQRALLALLLVHANETLSRDRLIEELWGDTAPETVESAFHVYLSRLRRLLDAADAGGLLARQPHGYTLRVRPEQLDASRFETLVTEGSAALAAGQAEVAADRFRQAFALWRGPPLADLQSERFAVTAAARLDEERLAALEQRIEADLGLARHRELVAELEPLVAEHPYRERLRAQLMLALYRSGRQAEALRAYQEARRTFADELGLEPGPELKELEQSILRQDPALRLNEAAAVPLRREDEPAEATDATVRTSPRRDTTRRVWAVAAVIVALAAALSVVLATRGGKAHATALAANSVGLIDAHGNRIRDQVAVDNAPTSVAYRDASLWVTNAYAGTVSRVDPEKGSVQTIPVGNSPNGVAVDAHGVWVANHDDGNVSWINPESNTEVKKIQVGNGPTAVAVGYGAVWVTNSDDRTVSRIDSATGDVIRDPIRTNAVGRGIVVGAGAVWVTDESTGRVVEVDPRTNTVTAKPAVGGGPAGIVYGDGALWIADELDGTVVRVDPTTLAVRRAIPVAGSPSALAFGDGGLWVSAEFGRRVVRIDPGTGNPTAAIGVGNRPKGLVATPGGVWVAVQASGTGHRGGRLVVVDDGFPTIDPGLENQTNTGAMLGLAYDGLTAFRRAGGSEGTQLVPDLAVALPQPTDGGRSYTFRLRHGIRYSDGSLLRAEDFRRALQRMFALGSLKLQGSPLEKVVGASRCVKGRRCDLSRGVIVNGPDSLTFRLATPYPTFLLGVQVVVPVPRGTPLKDVGTKAIPATGPYAIASYAPGPDKSPAGPRVILRLVRNRFFRSWSPAARPNGYPDEIVWRIDVPPREAVRDVNNGKADIIFNTVPGAEELAARYPRRLHRVAQNATVFVFLNTRRAPFDDIRVRRALNYAVDRKRMADLHGAAEAQPTCQIVPPTVPGYRRHCPYTVAADAGGEWKAPDLAKARALVAASGTSGEKIVVWTFSFFEKEGRYFVSLLRTLGYRAQLREIPDIDKYFPKLDRTPTVQAGLAGWFGGLLAADSFESLNCRFTSNWAHFCDRRIDAQVRRLAAEEARDPTAGAALAARIDRELVAKAPWVPLFTPKFVDFVSERVGNYQPTNYASSSVLLDQLWVR